MNKESYKDKEGYKEWIKIGAWIATMLALVFVGFQSCQLEKSIDLQTKEMELDKRPYLYIEPTIVRAWRTKTDQHIRTEFIIKNVGKIPASNIDYNWDINDGYGPRPTPIEAYREEFGEVHFPRTVFPGQIIELPTYSPSISPNTKKLSLAIKVTYSGVRSVSEKPYWYEYRRDYIFPEIEGKLEEMEIGVIALPPYTNWDREK